MTSKQLYLILFIGLILLIIWPKKIQCVSDIKSILFPFTALAGIREERNDVHSKYNLSEYSKFATQSPIYCDLDEWLCNDQLRCVPKAAICDRSQDCIDNSDELNCENKCRGDQFRCDNGQCVDQNRVCDNIFDCEDESDEFNLGPNCLGQDKATTKSFRIINNFQKNATSFSNLNTETDTFVISTKPTTSINSKLEESQYTTEDSFEKYINNISSPIFSKISKLSNNKSDLTKQSFTSTVGSVLKDKPQSQSVISASNKTSQTILVNSHTLNAPYLRIFPLVSNQSIKDNSSLISSTVNLTAPRNKGEEDDEFDKRRNNDQLVKISLTTTTIRPTPSPIIKSSNLNTKMFLNRQPIQVSESQNKNLSSDVHNLNTKKSDTNSSVSTLSHKNRKKNKSAVSSNKLATGRAAIDIGLTCPGSKTHANCFYGIFRCVNGKCTITSFECGAVTNKGRRISVSQSDFNQFL